MKTTTIRMLGKGLTALCLMLWSYAGFAQPAVLMNFTNFNQTSPTTFTYDVTLTNTGTTNFDLRAYSWGLHTQIGIGNGGAITQAFVTRDAILSTIPNVNTNPAASVTTLTGSAAGAFHIRGTTVAAAAGNEVPMAPGIPYLIARMQITSANGFPSNFNPFFPAPPGLLSIQTTTGAGKTQCIAQGLVAGVNTTIVPIGSSAAGVQGLTATSTPSISSAGAFKLNPQAACVPVVTTTTATACDSYTWSVNSQTYTTSGLYFVTIPQVADPNCLDTAYLNLTINYSTSNSTTASACDSYTWSVNNTTYTASGIYSATSLNAAGCVHTENLDLTITPSSTTTTTASACDSYVWNGNTYTATGMYTGATVNCVTEMLDLTITPSSTTTTTASACDSYVWNGNTYTATGMYTGATVNCVTEMLDLTITPSSTNTTTASACDSYVWNGNTYTASGTYTGATVNCVTDVLNLTITPSSTTTTTASACDSYVWNGNTYTASGMYTGATVNCVTEMLDLTITPSSTTTTTAAACDSYVWNGNTYTASGMYTGATVNCVTEMLDLTITASTTNTTTASACDSYTWSVNNTTYTASGTYSVVNGCATDVLNLTITPSSNTSVTVSACDSYSWNGNTYTASGTYTFNNGCATETLNLTITPSSTSTTTASACDSYVWNGNTYTVSGMYTGATVNCVTEMLDLTVNYSTTSPATASACDSYTWNQNNVTYTASGVYTATGLTAAGCQDLHVLTLTITPSTNTTTTASACDSYVWNGNTYTASGIYTVVNGCATENLDLTITPSSTTTTTASACDSYVWNGNTYTATGMYTGATVNCVTEMLDLTINNSSSNTTNVSANGSYTWAVNGVTYNASGTYTATNLNAGGCVNTETLNLTIVPVVTCSFTLTVIEDQPISCFGNDDASLLASALPAGSYTYTIVSPTAPSSSNTNGYFDQLEPGTHTVYATDGTNTCAQTINFVEPDPLDMTFNIDSVVSCLGNDGALSVNITGGTNILQGYLTWWTNSNGDTLNDILTNNFALNLENLPADTYNVAIEDDRGCFYNESFVLPGATPIVMNSTFTPIACNGGTTVITPSATGGVPYSPLVYTINGAAPAASYTAGSYTIVATDAKGCSASEVLNITEPAAISGASSETACDTYSWNGNTYTMSGVYVGTFMAANGCDSVHTLNLTINYSTTVTTNATACDTYTWSQNGATYTTSGTYTALGTNTSGCPETYVLNLTVNYSSSNTTTATACDTYTWTANGMTYTMSGMYTATSLNAAGCVHTETLDLTVNYSTTSNDVITACDSYTWSQNGMTYTASGNYSTTYINAAGCLHSATLNLTINTGVVTTSSANWCDMYTWNGVTYTTSGTYTHTSLNANGCVNTDILNLTLGQTQVNIICCISACDSYTWAQNGVTYTASGNYYVIGQQPNNGCPIVYTLCLTINNSTSSSETATACGSYTWAVNGMTYTASGIYTATSLNAAGCLHTTTLDLTINQGTTTTSSATACDSYTWAANGMTYTASGTYTHTMMNSAGCVNTDILNLTINSSTSSSLTATACDTYTWAENGATYTMSGTYVHTSLNAAGCVNTATLNLTVNYSSTSSTTATACDSYTWADNGMTYTTSGTYVYTSLNAAGCVNTATLNLTVNYTSYSQASATACDSYFWLQNGMTYTASGVYTATGVNPLGCPDVHTLTLTVNYSSSSNTTATACDSYTWTENGATYTTSGTYVHTSLNASGCVNTATLNLTVNYSSSSNMTATACDTYTWAENGMTYTTSGTYVHTSLNASGCVNTATLNLTVNYSSSSNTTATACDSYTWTENGATYTMSGTYVHTSLNASGCVNTATLNLTVNYSSSSNMTATACDTYTWAENGATYTMSGTYVHTSLNASGCVNTATLNLTVNYSSSSNTTATACDSYTWTENGATYTTSGTYVHTSLNASGCVNTATLNLTVNYSSTDGGSTTTQCNEYTWNGTTYTASGVYTFTTLNASGCVNTATLNLTINYGSSSTTQVAACNSYTWTNGVTYTAAGTYTYTTLNSVGCDSALTLILTLTNGVSVSPKALLSGAYMGGGLMQDSLRSRGVLPLTEPYTLTLSGFTPIGCPGYNGGETTTPAMFAVTGNDAIVDWVHVEIRSTDAAYSKVATQNALIQRDGDIVDVNGNPLYFPCVCPGNYFITVKHRNHLGVMTEMSLPLTSTTTSVDFTTAAPVWTKPGVANAARETAGAFRLLWPGDTRTDKNVKYNGLNNDKEPIIYAVGIATPNNILEPVYRTEDANMDGRVKYNNADNDKNFILNKIIASNAPVSTPNDILSQHTPN